MNHTQENRTAFSRRTLIQAAFISAILLTDHHGRTRAQQGATPRPTWQPSGLLHGAIRQFEASGPRFFGSSFIWTVALVFDAKESAEAAFPDAVDYTTEVVTFYSNARHLREASAPRSLGDEVIAYVAEIVPAEGSQHGGIAAMVVWRDGDTIYTVNATGPSGDLLFEVFAISLAIAGRNMSIPTLATPASSSGMRVGGVWDLLPTLEDLPPGYVFFSETLIR